MSKYITNYVPGSMSFGEGFLGPRGNVGFSMVLDRNKARKIVRNLLKEGKNIERAEIGLDGDWRENSEILYSDGKMRRKPEFTMHDNSIWATPGLMVYFEDEPSRFYEVWKKKDA